jgi:general secretion pathway protein G
MKRINSFLRSNQICITSVKDGCSLNETIGFRKMPDGFTLIELLIVIAIIGTLTGIAIPKYRSFLNQGKVETAKSVIRSIETEILTFKSEHGRFPDSLAEIGLDGLKDPYGNPYQYIPAPEDDKKDSKDDEKSNKKGGNKGGASSGNDGSAKDKMRKDRNLHPVNTDFDLYSMGEDGKSVAPFTAKVSQDDVVRANDGQFIGLVSAY